MNKPTVSKSQMKRIVAGAEILKNFQITLEEYQGMEMFVENTPIEKVIAFMCCQQRAIDGLTANNKSFSEAYQKMLNQKL